MTDPNNSTEADGLRPLPRAVRFLVPTLVFVAWPLLAAEPGPGKSLPPASILHPAKEMDLATLTLTPEAEKRLGIETAPVERRKLQRTRLLSGEITLPSRRNGNTNAVGQSVFAILPSFTPVELVRLAQSQIDADGQVEQAGVQLDVARSTLARAEQMMRDKAGLARTLDEARAQMGLAEAGLRTARAKRDLLGPPVIEAAAQPVCWVRVPVYVGDVARLDASAEARVGGLSDAPGAETRPARSVAAPPSANPATATVDWFYELSNQDGLLRFGQRVGVSIPLRDSEECLVVPWSAVIHDVQGGTWLYERTSPQTYTRRRVQVRHVVGGQAALASGVKVGANVVSAGVAELFGTEFGAGK